MRQRIRLVCREAALTVDRPREARRLASAATIAAVERIARTDPRHAATIDEWDRDPQSLADIEEGLVDVVVVFRSRGVKVSGDLPQPRPPQHQGRFGLVRWSPA